MLAATPLAVAAGQGSGSALRSAVPLASGVPSRRPSLRNAPPSTKAAALARSSPATTAASRAPTARRRPLSSPPAAGYVRGWSLVSHVDQKSIKKSALRAETRSPLFPFWFLGGGMPSFLRSWLSSSCSFSFFLFNRFCLS